mgnify:CR=1 FL=1
MTNILTTEQVKEALYLDDDANVQMLEMYSNQATSYIFHKTGYDFSKDIEKEPLAILCAQMYIRQIYFGSTGYNKQHDYLIGIGGLISDLQIIADEKLKVIL